jgi:hypothetical protein
MEEKLWGMLYKPLKYKKVKDYMAGYSKYL